MVQGAGPRKRDSSVTCRSGLSLALSVKTVSTYRTRILEKMGLHSNADLIRYVLHHGLGD